MSDCRELRRCKIGYRRGNQTQLRDEGCFVQRFEVLMDENQILSRFAVKRNLVGGFGKCIENREYF